jgi:hypothetical protein
MPASERNDDSEVLAIEATLRSTLQEVPNILIGLLTAETREELRLEVQRTVEALFDPLRELVLLLRGNVSEDRLAAFKILVARTLAVALEDGDLEE